MSTADDSPIVFSFNLSSLLQLLQFAFLLLCAYALLRCIHILQRYSRREKKGKPSNDKSQLSSDQSKSTIEESVTSEASNGHIHRRKSFVNNDRFYSRSQRTHATSAGVEKRTRSRQPTTDYHRGYSNSPRFNYRIKRHSQPSSTSRLPTTTRTSGHDPERRYDYVPDTVTNQSFLDSETQPAIVGSRPERTTSIFECSSLRDIESNRQPFADNNDVDPGGKGKGVAGGGGGSRAGGREIECKNPSPYSFESVNKPVTKSEETRVKSDDTPDRNARIKFSDQSAAAKCHRRFLAGTQEEGAYHPFPSASDRLDCATQFVSREPSNVIDLSPSPPKTYLTVETNGVSYDPPLLESPVPRDIKKSKRVRKTSSATKHLRPGKQSKTRESRQSSPSVRQGKGSPTPQQQPKSSQHKTAKARPRRGEGCKNKMANNSSWKFPDLNTNYAAAVSLQECGRELNRLIQDTMRDYGDWSVTGPRSCEVDKDSSETVTADCITESQKPRLKSSSRVGNHRGEIHRPTIRFCTVDSDESDNANGNKSAGDGEGFRYNPKPTARIESKNQLDESRPVKLENLLRELETLTKRINHHYDNDELLKKRKNNERKNANSYNCSAAPERHDNTLDSSDEIRFPNTITMSGHSGTCCVNGKTHSVHSNRRSLRLEPSQLKVRSPLVTTTISQRKKVFVQTCPVPLNETEIVCYMELVPKYNHPTGGLQVFKLDTVPSYPQLSAIDSTTQVLDSLDPQNSDYLATVTYPKEVLVDNFSDNKISDSKKKSVTELECLYQAGDGTLEIACNGYDNGEITYTARKSLNDMTRTQSCTVGNHGDNNKARTLKNEDLDQGYKTAFTSPLKKTQELCITKKVSPAKRGSYVANFRKNLRRRQIALASSPKARKNNTSNKSCVAYSFHEKEAADAPNFTASSLSPSKTSPRAQTRPFFKTTLNTQTESPFSSRNKNAKPGHNVLRNEISSLGNGRTIQKECDRPDYQDKASNSFHPDNRGKCDAHRELKHPHASPSSINACQNIFSNTKKAKNSGGNHSSKNSLNDIKKSDTKRSLINNGRISGKQTVLSSTNNKERRVFQQNSGVSTSMSLPHGPTESVRFEMKSALAFRIGQIRRKQKQKREHFRRRHGAPNSVRKGTRAVRASSLRQRLDQRSNCQTDKKMSLTTQSTKHLDSDSGIERNAVTVNFEEDKTKTMSSQSVFYHKGKFYRLKELQESSISPSQRRKMHLRGIKSMGKRQDVLNYLDVKCTQTSGQSVTTEFSSNVLTRQRKSNRHLLGNSKSTRKPTHLNLKKLKKKEGGASGLTNFSSKIGHATTSNKHKQCFFTRKSGVENSDSCDSNTTISSLFSGKQDFKRGAGLSYRRSETTLTDSTDIRDLKHNAHTFSNRSYSSPDLAQMQHGNQRNQIKFVKNNSLREANRISCLNTPRRRFSKAETSDSSESVESSPSIVRRGRSRSRHLRGGRNVAVDERRYEIHMNDKSLGVARFLGYCMSSTNGTELEETSSSTGFLLDTLDEISESLSDDNIVYW